MFRLITIGLITVLAALFGSNLVQPVSAVTSVVRVGQYCETDGTVRTWIEWDADYTASQQWVDISQVNGFVDGTYIGNGPLLPKAGAIKRYLLSGTTYYVRVTALRGSIFDVSRTFTFTTIRCAGVPTTLLPSAAVTASVRACTLQTGRLSRETGRVVPPASSVPAAIRGFSGVFEGIWIQVNSGFTAPTTLIVTSVSPVQATAVYLFGPDVRQLHTYDVVDSAYIRTTNGAFVWRLSPNGNIEGKLFFGGVVTSTIEARRCSSALG